MFDFAETMVNNLKSWAIVIFVLNSHISCQSLKHTKKNPVSCHQFDTDVHVSFVSLLSCEVT